MDLNWLESLFLGLISGFTDVLPVSSQAHKAIFLKIFGETGEPVLLRLSIHLAVFAVLYYCSSNQLRRLVRQLRLARIPKKKRRRPLDSKTVAEFKVLRVMLIPVICSLFLYPKTAEWGTRLNLTAIFLLLNGVILYLPKLMPTGNKDALSMSVIDSFLLGFGSLAGVLPGVSTVGTMLSLGSLCGAERQFTLSMTYLGQLVITAGLIFMDLLTVFGGSAAFNVPVLICCLAGAVAASVGTYFGIRFMRVLASNAGFGAFAFYSFGAALFSFIIYLMV